MKYFFLTEDIWTKMKTSEISKQDLSDVMLGEFLCSSSMVLYVLMPPGGSIETKSCPASYGAVVLFIFNL